MYFNLAKTQKWGFSPKYLHNVRLLGSKVGNFEKGWQISSCMMKLLQYWQVLSCWVEWANPPYCWENISLSMMKLHEYSKVTTLFLRVIVRATETSSWPKKVLKKCHAKKKVGETCVATLSFKKEYNILFLLCTYIQCNMCSTRL